MTRTILSRWPWVTMLLAVAIAVSPFGLELIYGAFASSEAISRDISRFLLWIVGAILAAAIVLEWLLRWWLAKRRRA